MFSTINNQETLNKALKLCRGIYQKNLLLGKQRLSGADLSGNAKKYIGKYRQSSKNLLNRLQAAGLNIREIRGHHNRREIIID